MTNDYTGIFLENNRFTSHI